MSFWNSEMGTVTGTQEDAFIKEFSIIPDGTMALSKITGFVKQVKQGLFHYEVEWEITDGEFKRRKVIQKIKAFDSDPKVRHRALNMLKLLYIMFKIKPETADEPSDKELVQFISKIAGIRIREWAMEKQDGSGIMEGNFISEVHQAAGFKSETGVKMSVTHVNTASSQSSLPEMDSAFNRQSAIQSVDDDLPF